jgi:hypothetical protein
MKYKIDKNRPIPKNVSKYPFPEMEVGDSFVVSDKNLTVHDIEYKRIASSAFMYGKKTGKKFKLKSVENKLICWRIK